jgi:hypothetical protein
VCDVENKKEEETQKGEKRWEGSEKNRKVESKKGV